MNTFFNARQHKWSRKSGKSNLRAAEDPLDERSFIAKLKDISNVIKKLLRLLDFKEFLGVTIKRSNFGSVMYM
jgi:hypothetical protein